MDNNTSSIGELIKAFLRTHNLEEKMEEVDIVHNWEELAGTIVAKHTKEVKLKNGVLILKLSSAPLRHTLSFSKTEFIEKLNAALGQELIRDLELR